MSDSKTAVATGAGVSSPAPAEAAAADEHVLPPVDLVSPQLTLRSLLTGLVLGGLLCTCNIYTGLTIGWGLSMSITAVLLTYAFWTVVQQFGARPYGVLENLISQTICASACAVSSAGLVAPIPALTMLTGRALPWLWLAVWVFAVCLVGITVAIPLRRQMILVDKLPFPGGVATAETLREMYAKGKEALARVQMLLGATLVAIIVKLHTVTPPSEGFKWLLRKLHLPFFPLDKVALPLTIKGFSAKALTFSLDPSLLMVGVGGLIGIRACVSLIVGAVVAWLVLAPPLISRSYIRITVSESLPVLPAGVAAERLSPATANPRYRADARVLEYKGVMPDAQRHALLALDPEPRWQAVVEKLFLRSQLPPRTNLDYTTVREVRTSVPLDRWPRGLSVPREFGHQLRYLQAKERLAAFGAPTEECRARFLERTDELDRTHPEKKAECDAVRAAVDQLWVALGTPWLPPATSWPGALADRVTYDETTRTLRARGRLTPDDGKALDLVWSSNEDWKASVKTLADGSKYDPDVSLYNDGVQWLLWPGVTLMVISSLVAFGFTWRSMVRTFSSLGRKATGGAVAQARAAVAGPGAVTSGAVTDTGEVSGKWFGSALLSALVLAVVLQIILFQISWWAALIGVLLSFALALVAARVSGETGVTPVGAMGKITQLAFGVLVPRNPVPNLMAANVTGGAASQCADLLHDLKCGSMLGGMPRKQVLAQIAGAVIGSLVGSFVYLVLIPNPAEQLMTDQWPAPAVAAWKAVAELFAVGLKALPQGTRTAILIAGVFGVLLPVLEKTLSKKARLFVPSAASLGLGFVIPGFQALSIFLGGLLVWIVSRLFPNWSKRFTIAICAGLVAGESLTGVGMAFERMIAG